MSIDEMLDAMRAPRMAAAENREHELAERKWELETGR